MSAPFVLAAGGTGGHVFPAEALAGELLAHGRNVHLLCDGRADSFAPDLGIVMERAPINLNPAAIIHLFGMVICGSRK